MSNISILKYSISCMLQDQSRKFAWKLLVVYGSPNDDGKKEFLDELHYILATWSGLIVGWGAGGGGGGFQPYQIQFR
jgi:hypothetical protein